MPDNMNNGKINKNIDYDALLDSNDEIIIEEEEGVIGCYKLLNVRIFCSCSFHVDLVTMFL